MPYLPYMSSIGVIPFVFFSTCHGNAAILSGTGSARTWPHTVWYVQSAHVTCRAMFIPAYDSFGWPLSIPTRPPRGKSWLHRSPLPVLPHWYGMEVVPNRTIRPRFSVLVLVLEPNWNRTGTELELTSN
ncbi:hypothetical protein CALCODRAFT_64306 [Calocera cornea HHB12733]|uniref:Uncharacterized protein n=1 Tax=Calocera cornea HHB12733 TaxID=1353952 RepID=A0A165DKN1_9BASI|nr:hypothetical protein CALCODRAFT_64306 [Calocera cornea HHB12733]